MNLTLAARLVAAQHPGPGDEATCWRRAVLAVASLTGDEAAAALGISVRTYRRWVEQLRDDGVSVETPPRGRRWPPR